MLPVAENLQITHPEAVRPVRACGRITRPGARIRCCGNCKSVGIGIILLAGKWGIG